MANIKLAVLGYNSDIGKAFFELASDSGIEFETLIPLSYTAQEYDAANLMGKNIEIESPDNLDWEEINVLMIIGHSGDAKKLIPEAKSRGIKVIDASGVYDNSDYVYVNATCNDECSSELENAEVIAPMNSSASLLTQILQPIEQEYGIKSAVATLMEAVSGLGEEGTSELARETIALLNMKDIKPRLFKSQLAFNVHTVLGTSMADGVTTHEDLVKQQLSNVLGKVADNINVTCVLVPVFYGFTLTLTLELNSDNYSVDDFVKTLEKTDIIEYIDEEITPTEYGMNEANISVSRIRIDANNPNKVSLVAVMDNARRGAAYNCLGIIEQLAKR